jgi:hypothetical protein
MHAIKSGGEYVYIFSGAMVTDTITPMDAQIFQDD